MMLLCAGTANSREHGSVGDGMTPRRFPRQWAWRQAAIKVVTILHLALWSVMLEGVCRSALALKCCIEENMLFSPAEGKWKYVPVAFSTLSRLA